MANTIITKNSSVGYAVPSAASLAQGELAVNLTDKRLYSKNGGGQVVEIGRPVVLEQQVISTTTSFVEFTGIPYDARHFNLIVADISGTIYPTTYYVHVNLYNSSGTIISMYNTYMFVTGSGSTTGNTVTRGIDGSSNNIAYTGSTTSLGVTNIIINAVKNSAGSDITYHSQADNGYSGSTYGVTMARNSARSVSTTSNNVINKIRIGVSTSGTTNNVDTFTNGKFCLSYY